MPANKNSTTTPELSSEVPNLHVSKVEAKMAELMQELEEVKKKDKEEKKLVEQRRLAEERKGMGRGGEAG